jgi:hypothetical protein
MELALLLPLLSLYLLRTGANRISFDPDEMSATDSSCPKMLLAGFLCTCILAFLTFLLRSLILPHGGWDAWQTWNLFARFLYRGGNHWRDAFSTRLNPHHPDYPLLIPATIARCWQYMGNETQIVPVITAGVFTSATIGLLFSSTALLKDRSQALLAGIILTGTPYFVILGSMQYADVPLGFFFLAALVLCAFQERAPENHRFSLLAGIMTGFSCWTKNEGFMFLLSLILAQLVADAVTTRKRHILSFLAGAAPVMALVLFFKWNLAPANDLFSRQELSLVLSKFLDLSRYLLILKSFFLTGLNGFLIVLLMVFYLLYAKFSFSKKDKRTFLILLVTLFSVLAGYFLVYILTPYDLDWHLATSLSRLLVQLWPSIIFTFSLMSHTPEEAWGRSRNV